MQTNWNEDIPPFIPGDVAVECEAFLGGRYLELLRSRGRAIPAWAWLNGVTHGAVDQLDRLATAPTDGTAPEALVASIAQRTLWFVRHRGMSLSLLQQVTLAPVEAKLLDGGWGACPGTAAELGAVLWEAAQWAGIAE